MGFGTPLMAFGVRMSDIRYSTVTGLPRDRKPKDADQQIVAPPGAPPAPAAVGRRPTAVASGLA